MRAVPTPHVAAAAALAAAALALGCGGSSDPGPTTTSRAGARPAAEQTSPVSVLGSRVAVDDRHVALSLRLRQPAGVDPPTAETATVTLPDGIAYRGDARPACSAATIRRGGAAACPSASRIGTGVAIGLADTAETRAAITIVNGGPHTVLLATVIRNPAYVKTVVTGRIVADAGAGLKIDLAFPADLQQVGGVPVGLQQLDLTLDRGGVVALGACPPADAPWRYAASVRFADATVVGHRGSATCSGAGAAR